MNHERELEERKAQILSERRLLDATMDDLVADQRAKGRLPPEGQPVDPVQHVPLGEVFVAARSFVLGTRRKKKDQDDSNR